MHRLAHLAVFPFLAFLALRRLVHVVSQLSLLEARFQLSSGEILRFVAHHRFDRQLCGESPA